MAVKAKKAVTMAKSIGCNNFKCLLSAAGLSLTEAADYLDVSRKNITRWANGTLEPPAGVLNELTKLIQKQNEAVKQTLDLIGQSEGVGEYEIGFPTDGTEAKDMGWPSVSAFKMVAGRIIAEATDVIKVVPRGSTVGTAAAADVQDRMSPKNRSK